MPLNYLPQSGLQGPMMTSAPASAANPWSNMPQQSYAQLPDNGIAALAQALKGLKNKKKPLPGVPGLRDQTIANVQQQGDMALQGVPMPTMPTGFESGS
jgi:hypothetical protein